MARKPRIEFPGALYHVIARGNHRQPLFHDDADRGVYLGRLEHYRQRYGMAVYAYVLMANHMHLLIEMQTTPLSKFMQGLQFTYTRYYNRKYAKVGHLFQGRYQAVLCDREAYLLELVRYVHLNPARLRRALDPWRYPWSSHRAYLGEPCPVVVETSLVLAQFAQRVGQARAAYLQYMEEGLGRGHEARYYETVDQRLLGDERFIEEVARRTGGKREIARESSRVPFAVLVRAVAEEQGVDPRVLFRAGRQRTWVPARAMVVYLGREWSGMKTKGLARQLQRDPSVISRLYQQYAAARDLKTEAKLLRIFQK